jgi:hypothetical protein
MLAGSPCPITGVIGQPVDTITLKALLVPTALAKLDPQAQYEFCPDPTCDTVYFSEAQTFERHDVEVPVLAKDLDVSVPVCYCFGWTRERIQAVGDPAFDEIRAHVVAGRCGCEVKNPKGACCMGDVVRVLSARPCSQRDQQRHGMGYRDKLDVTPPSAS